MGETVVPMYVDQSRDALDMDKSVYEVIAEGSDEVRRGGSLENLGKLVCIYC